MIAAVAALAILIADEWRFRVSVAQPQAAPFEEQADDDYYAVLFTASWCGPCQRYKQTTLPAVQQLLKVTQTDMDRSPEYWRTRVVQSGGKPVTVPAVTSIPTVWLVRKSDRMPVARWRGGATPAQIAAELKRLRSQ